MTATNHALTGAIIGLTVVNPLVAMIAAFVSHYICDAIPHYDSADPDRLRKKSFRAYLVADTVLCVLLVILLALTQPAVWILASLCAFLATSPDLFWINRYRHILRRTNWSPNWHSRFASKIQWFERPIGAVVEVVWFVLAIVLLAKFI